MDIRAAPFVSPKEARFTRYIRLPRDSFLFNRRSVQTGFQGLIHDSKHLAEREVVRCVSRCQNVTVWARKGIERTSGNGRFAPLSPVLCASHRVGLTPCFGTERLSFSASRRSFDLECQPF